MVKIEWNDDALNKAVAEAVQNLQGDVNEELRATSREVRDDMSGEPADAVYDELVRRMTEKIPTFEPNEAKLREVAHQIQDGTLKG